MIILKVYNKFYHKFLGGSQKFFNILESDLLEKTQFPLTKSG